MTAASRVSVPVRVERFAGEPLSPRSVQALWAYAETGDQRAAARHLNLSYQTLKNYLAEAYGVLGVTSALGAYRAMGWLDTTGSHADLTAAYVAELEARLAAIHHESDALLSELRREAA